MVMPSEVRARAVARAVARVGARAVARTMQSNNVHAVFKMMQCFKK